MRPSGMDRAIAAILAVAALTGCGPRTVALAEGQCRDLRVGDRVQGFATLNAYAGGVCIECGAKLRQSGCAVEIGYRNASEQANAEYDRMLRRLPRDEYDYISGTVFVSGTIIDDGADGSPLLNADTLRAAEGRSTSRP